MRVLLFRVVVAARPPQWVNRWLPVDSSWISAVRFQPPVLWILRTDGVAFACPEVSPEMVLALLEAPSKGRFFNR